MGFKVTYQGNNYGKNAEKRRKGRHQVEEGILSALSEGPSHYKQIGESVYGKLSTNEWERKRSSIVKALRRLKGRVIQIPDGRWALPTFIPFEDVVKRVSKVIETLAIDYSMVTLDDIAAKAYVPKSWKIAVGNTEVNFEAVVYMLARERGDLEIGPERVPKKHEFPAQIR